MGAANSTCSIHRKATNGGLTGANGVEHTKKLGQMSAWCGGLSENYGSSLYLLR